MLHAQLDQLPLRRMQVGFQCRASSAGVPSGHCLIIRLSIVQHERFPARAPPTSSSMATKGYRLTASTGIHKGDREYQQDQVTVVAHPRVPGCVLAVVADGMGGRSGG